MRAKKVIPTTNFIMYVFFEEGVIYKMDMSDIIENDDEFFELKYNPDLFWPVIPVNEGRCVAWGDKAILPVKVIEEQGAPVDVGFLQVYSRKEIEFLQERMDDPPAKYAMEHLLGEYISLEGWYFFEFEDWLHTGFMFDLENDEPTETALFFEMLEDSLWWPEENIHEYNDLEMQYRAYI